MAPNPYYARYLGRKLIVEFDLYGEFWGRMDVPHCCPEYLYNMIRTMKAFGALGAVGRVVHDDRRPESFPTIFQSPNEINCYAFARYLSRPIPWIDDTGVWDIDVDAFDESVWTDWVSKRYGNKAAIPLIRALKRTRQIVPLIFDVGGRWFQNHSGLPAPNWTGVVWPGFTEQLKKAGIDYLRDEKQRACEMVEQCLANVETAKKDVSEKDYWELRKLFEGELLVAQAFQALLEGYHQLYLAEKSPNPEGLKLAAERLHALSVEVTQARGEKFYHSLARTLDAQSNFVAKGRVKK
jgi:hypothetical protein